MTKTEKARKIIETVIVCPLCQDLKAKIMRGMGCCVNCADKHCTEIRVKRG